MFATLALLALALADNDFLMQFNVNNKRDPVFSFEYRSDTGFLWSGAGLGYYQDIQCDNCVEGTAVTTPSQAKVRVNSDGGYQNIGYDSVHFVGMDGSYQESMVASRGSEYTNMLITFDSSGNNIQFYNQSGYNVPYYCSYDTSSSFNIIFFNLVDGYGDCESIYGPFFINWN